MHFPELAGEDLTGRALEFPRDFTVPTVALVAFAVDARAEVETWVPFLDAELARRDDRRARLFAVAPKGLRLMKGAVVQGLRAAARTPERREATVLAFADIDAVCTALGIGEKDGVHVFAVAPGGAVLAAVHGVRSEDATAAIRKAFA